MATTPDLSGRILGQYQIIERIGVGGMAAVYRAYQSKLRREVALKILPDALAENPQYEERFEREAATAASLEHPHIVPIFDYGTDHGISYVAMRLLTGGSLGDRMANREKQGADLPSLSEIARLLKQVGSALDYAHGRGVIHRDIKPSNIMFDDQGNPFIVDFGIAKVLHATSGITSTGQAMGTPAFMAPEQWRAETPSPATDQYALGVLVYAMLTGRIPFEAPTPFGLMHLHMNEFPTAPSLIRADIPDSVNDVINRAMAKKPEDRYPTITAFAEDFQAAISGMDFASTNFFTFTVPKRTFGADNLPSVSPSGSQGGVGSPPSPSGGVPAHPTGPTYGELIARTPSGPNPAMISGSGPYPVQQTSGSRLANPLVLGLLLVVLVALGGGAVFLLTQGDNGDEGAARLAALEQTGTAQAAQLTADAITAVAAVAQTQTAQPSDTPTATTPPMREVVLYNNSQCPSIQAQIMRDSDGEVVWEARAEPTERRITTLDPTESYTLTIVFEDPLNPDTPCNMSETQPLVFAESGSTTLAARTFLPEIAIELGTVTLNNDTECALAMMTLDAGPDRPALSMDANANDDASRPVQPNIRVKYTVSVNDPSNEACNRSDSGEFVLESASDVFTYRVSELLATDAPTREPTEEVSPLPPVSTEVPTEQATASVTVVAQESTVTPTDTPTEAPTHTPTASLTEAPTNTVSPTLTEAPTDTPTASPTNDPNAFLDPVFEHLSANFASGQNVTRQNTTFNYTIELFTDNYLGCPPVGVSVTPAAIQGYLIYIDYNGREYEYRLSADGSVLIYCLNRAAHPSSILPGAAPTEAPTAVARAEGIPIFEGVSLRVPAQWTIVEDAVQTLANGVRVIPIVNREDYGAIFNKPPDLTPLPDDAIILLVTLANRNNDGFSLNLPNDAENVRLTIGGRTVIGQRYITTNVAPFGLEQEATQIGYWLVLGDNLGVGFTFYTFNETPPARVFENLIASLDVDVEALLTALEAEKPESSITTLTLLTYGSVTRNYITTNVPAVQYSIFGESGQTVVIDLIADDTTVLNPILTLFDPNGEIVAENDDLSAQNPNAQLVYTFPQQGLYTIVASAEEGVGGFVLKYQLDNSRSAESTTSANGLRYGESVAGSITASTPSNSYTFNGTAGDVIEIKMEAQSGDLDPQLVLLGPDDVQIASNDDEGPTLNARLQVRLRQNGTYTIIATSYSGSGDYSLSLEKIETSDLSGLTYGSRVLGGMNTDVSVTSYMINVQQWDFVEFEINVQSGNLSPLLSIVDLDGQPLLLVRESRALYRAQFPQTGVYVVNVHRNAGAGNYTLIANKIDGAKPVTSFDTLILGDVDEQIPTAVYVFKGAENDSVRITTEVMQATRSQTVQLEVNVRLLAPNGRRLAFGESSSRNFTVTLEAQLQQKGTYTIIITRKSGSGNYTLTLSKGGDTSAVDDTLPPTDELLQLEMHRPEYVRGRVQAYDTSSGKRLWVQESQQGVASEIAFAPDSSMLTTLGINDSNILIDDVRSVKLESDVQQVKINGDAAVALLSYFRHPYAHVVDLNDGTILFHMLLDGNLTVIGVSDQGRLAVGNAAQLQIYATP